jgi:amino acid adenylation domain-containing protein
MQPLDLEAIRGTVAELLSMPAEELGEHDDLISLGLNSLQVMKLASRWRAAGAPMTYADMVPEMTVAAWSKLAGAAPAGSLPLPAEPVSTEPIFPLAPLQEAYWVGRHDSVSLGGVDAHYYAELDGVGVEPDRLEAAIRALFDRHEMLRACFRADGLQEIVATSPWPGLTVHDLRRVDHSTRTRELDGHRRRLMHRRMDVEHASVFDAELSLLPGGATRLHVNIEMLVADAASFAIVLDDLAQLYAEPDHVGAVAGIGFGRCLERQRLAREADREAAEAHWRQWCATAPGGPALPLAVDPERLVGQGLTCRAVELDAEVWDSLEERARRHGLTLSSALTAAFVEVLGAWSAEPRFLLNLPVFDRDAIHPEVDSVVGDFTNLVVVDVRLDNDDGFGERAHALQRRIHEAVAHLAYSGLEVLRDLGRARPGAQLAPVVFTSAFSMGDLFGARVRSILGRPGWTSSQTPQVWLDCQVTDRDGTLRVHWDVVDGLFEPGVVDAMFAAYEELVLSLARSDSAWTAPVGSMVPAAQRHARHAVNAVAAPISTDCLHDRFFAVAARSPERVALVWGEQGSMTYGALARLALGTAGRLRAAGVQPGDAVAVTQGRGPDQVAAVLGVLATGAAYVPVGADQPALRRQRIYANAAVVAVVGDDGGDGGDGVPRVQVGEGPEAPALTVPSRPDDIAYVIYTSGSTGEPKGVEVTHRSAVNTVADVNRRFEVTGRDRVLAVSALDFDLSVYDLFGLLSVGGSVVLVGEDDRREAKEWVALCRRWSVSIWNSVPALLDMALLAADPNGLGQALRLVLSSGDWIGLDLPARLRSAAPAARFVGLGGATEAAIWSNQFEVVDVHRDLDGTWRSIPYGTPLSNQCLRVVDWAGTDRPDWVPGELWIGGEGVARGYRNAASLSADRFVTRDGVRWYRTGDQARYRPGGIVELLGRLDQQVKIRGHRIELGEVEAAAGEHPAVRAAAAVVVDGALGLAVVAADTASAAAVRAFVAERLPRHMVPERVEVMTNLPLSANGKVNRAALAPRFQRPDPEATGCGQALTELEARLAAVWAEVLEVGGVGREQSFFDIGGDSLRGTRVVAVLRQRIGVDLGLRDLLAAPTVAELARLVDGWMVLNPMEEGAIL